MALASPLALIVGLGNPGSEYERARHNVGFWAVEKIAATHAATFRSEAKFHGEACKITHAGQQIWLLKPQTYMNNSGQSLAAMARFYKISSQEILVVHDDLDLPVGTVRLKIGGGHGGHNGLRDIVNHLSSKDFNRLRIGIGHPGNSRDVTNYVLKTASSEDQTKLESAISDALEHLPELLQGEFEQVMNTLHRADTQEKTD